MRRSVSYHWTTLLILKKWKRKRGVWNVASHTETLAKPVLPDSEVTLKRGRGGYGLRPGNSTGVLEVPVGAHMPG
eukprot:983813-Pelagomonas_calceolata.AAC.7